MKYVLSAGREPIPRKKGVADPKGKKKTEKRKLWVTHHSAGLVGKRAAPTNGLPPTTFVKEEKKWKGRFVMVTMEPQFSLREEEKIMVGGWLSVVSTSGE